MNWNYRGKKRCRETTAEHFIKAVLDQSSSLVAKFLALNNLFSHSTNRVRGKILDRCFSINRTVGFKLYLSTENKPQMLSSPSIETNREILKRKSSWGSSQLECLFFINTLRPRQNGRIFADDTFNCIFLNENIWISFEISLKFVPYGPINNIPALVQIIAWCRLGDKPLF